MFALPSLMPTGTATGHKESNMSLKLRVIGPSTTFAVVVVLLVSAAAAAARPTVTLTPACHDGTNPYAFTVSLSGFPPSLPFDARVRYSDINHDYVGLIATDAAGAYGPVGFGALTPLGRVSATITATIDGASQTFTADLSNPCFPPLGLRRAMCGDGELPDLRIPPGPGLLFVHRATGARSLNPHAHPDPGMRAGHRRRSDSRFWCSGCRPEPRSPVPSAMPVSHCRPLSRATALASSDPSHSPHHCRSAT